MNNTNLFKSLSYRKQVIAQHFAQANEYDKHADIQQQVCQLLLTTITNHRQNSVLEVGAGSGQMTRLLAKNVQSNAWMINELCAKQSPILQSILPTANIMIGDAETLNIGNAHSLIISANAVQWFDNPLRFIEQSYQNLQSGGQLLFNTFTPNNFLQIKALTGQGLDYPTIETWKRTLESSGFQHIELSTHRFDLKLPSPYAVLKHMQLTGVSTNQTIAATDKPFTWTKSRLKDFEARYCQQFAMEDSNGETAVILTYEVLIMNAFKP